MSTVVDARIRREVDTFSHYLDSKTRVTSVAVVPKGERLEPGNPVPLFQVSVGATYEPAPDAQRFLINAITRPPSPITILLNWKPR